LHLTNLTNKVGWHAWGPEEHEAYEKVRTSLANAPVLVLPDMALPYEGMTDASLVRTRGVMMQQGKKISYTSKKFTPTETRYTMGQH
jgi:hypothetical protein